MRKTLSFVLLAGVLASCASPYKPAGFGGGFSETQLGENVWRVSFRGNGYTAGERAEDFALLRSAELTLSNGFTHFAFANSRVDSSMAAVTSPTVSQTSGATTTTSGGGIVFIRRPSATNTVVMFKGKPGDSTLAYDATFVCGSLGAKYQVTCGAP